MAQTEAPSNQIANYKGVMLCNRPTHGPAPKGSTQAFVSRVDVKQPLGTNPPVQYRPPPQKKPPKEILIRHRKWLQQVQEKKEEQAKQLIGETVEQIERAKKLTETTAKQRKFLMTHPTEEQIKKAFNLENPLKKLIDNYDKPKWALTEEQQANEEEAEVDDLLKYVHELDFDKYVEDLEVQATLEILKNRISTLVEEQKSEKAPTAVQEEREKSFERGGKQGEALSKEKAERAMEKPAMVNEAEWDRSTKDGGMTKAQTKVARALAEKILKANPQLRGVHSNQSIRRLIEGGEGS